MLWIAFAAMALVAMVFVVRPLARELPRLRVLTGVAIVVIAASSAGVYLLVGSPGIPSGPGQTPDVGEMVASLASRLESQPDDVNGWKMLARSYMTIGNAAAAVDAYERAVELESAQNASTLVALGVAIAETNGRQVTPRAITIFENALALEPNNPEALFWGGIGAFNNGDRETAAQRWEQLLATNPPPEVANLLQVRIAEWRGEAAPQPQAAPVSSDVAAVVTASVGVSEAALSNLPGEAVVFIIARDPAQPSPPIAVARRMLSELPTDVSLGDRESMIPGRMLSAFAEFELVARVSRSGSPAEQSGDWFGSVIVKPADTSTADITISEQVP
jgi:cytochrome c-type biogenesis protein CcmH